MRKVYLAPLVVLSVVVLSVGLFASACTSDGPSAVQPERIERIRGNSIGWDSVLVTGDVNSAELFFIGGPMGELEVDPCNTEYSVDVTEEGDVVTLTLHQVLMADAQPVPCTLEGHRRQTSVRLTQPVADVVFVDGHDQTRQRAVDPANLLWPTAVPEGWSLQIRDLADATIMSWYRSDGSDQQLRLQAGAIDASEWNMTSAISAAATSVQPLTVRRSEEGAAARITSIETGGVTIAFDERGNHYRVSIPAGLPVDLEQFIDGLAADPNAHLLAIPFAAAQPTPDPQAPSVVVTATAVPGPAPVLGTWDIARTAIGGEAFPGTFWTGSEVVVMRTENRGNQVTGERWNPETNQATPIAASGLVWRVGAAMVWTGDEVLMVGGSNGPGLDQIGVAYNPTSDSWRPLADPPGVGDPGVNWVGGPAIWTGEEMIIWPAALAYAPATDSWRSIAESPLSPRAQPATVWTGSELVVWGGCFVENAQCDENNSGLLGDGAWYDVVTDTWTMVSPSPLTPAVHTVAGRITSEMIIVVTEASDQPGERAATFSPRSGEWTPIESPPLSDRRYAAGVWADDQFVLWGGGGPSSDAGEADGAAYNPATGTWSPLPVGPGPGRRLHSMIYAGDRLYISATRTQSPPLQLRLAALGN